MFAQVYETRIDVHVIILGKIYITCKYINIHLQRYVQFSIKSVTMWYKFAKISYNPTSIIAVDITWDFAKTGALKYCRKEIDNLISTDRKPHLIFQKMFRFTVFILSIFVLGTIADDDHGKDVVNLVKDSFDTEVGKKPTLVMFFAPW